MTESAGCANHPERAAGWRCVRCGRGYCGECVETRIVNTVRVWKCPLCGADCDPTGAAPAEEPRESFLAQLAGAFTYPLKGKGLWTVLIAPLVIAGTSFAAQFTIFGLAALLLVLAYLAAYLVKIIRSSASGDEDPPDWPEVGVEEMLKPLLMLLAAVLLYELPAFIAALSGASEGVVLARLLAGFLFLPMAVAIVAIANSFAALNPVLVGSWSFPLP